MTSAFGVALLHALVVRVQKSIERRIGRYELAFSHQVAQLERAISGDRLEELTEEEELEEEIQKKTKEELPEEVEEEEEEPDVSVHFVLNTPIYDGPKSEYEASLRKSSIARKSDEEEEEEEEDNDNDS